MAGRSQTTTSRRVRNFAAGLSGQLFNRFLTVYTVVNSIIAATNLKKRVAGTSSRVLLQ